ncbi:hypothetical protein [Streptomyces armeniacus]|nr:hypothetical protein [Streptomyces armeniacus]
MLQLPARTTRTAPLFPDPERESANGQDGGAAAAAVRFLPVRDPQTTDAIVAESGRARPDALL